MKTPLEQPSHTGESLYAVYQKTYDRGGIEVRGWWDIGPLERIAWNAVAKHANEKMS